MGKKPVAKGAEETAAPCCATEMEVQTITVVGGDKTPREELMKLPKAQIVRSMAIPENKTRFMVDVDDRTTQGKGIIALMESLGAGDATAIKTVTEILGALAGMLTKKRTQKK
jgi:hypothetical protein